MQLRVRSVIVRCLPHSRERLVPSVCPPAICGGSSIDQRSGQQLRSYACGVQVAVQDDGDGVCMVARVVPEYQVSGGDGLPAAAAAVAGGGVSRRGKADDGRVVGVSGEHPPPGSETRRYSGCSALPPDSRTTLGLRLPSGPWQRPRPSCDACRSPSRQARTRRH